MKHIDLFSGIGGFALAARWAGFETIAFCEREKYCQAVMNKNFPGVPIHDDVKHFSGSSFRGFGGIITGGYPCQPFSLAGKRNGQKDGRHLWPEMRRIIAEAEPAWVVAENVAGHITMGLDEVLSDLESLGYSATAIVIPACAVDAPHRRDRAWIVAKGHQRSGGNGSDTRSVRLEKWDRIQPQRPGAHPANQTPLRWSPEPAVGRVVNGLSGRVDRIRALGSAIVPQVAYQIFEAIKATILI